MKILFHTPTGTTKPYPRADDELVVGLSADYKVFDLIEPARPTHDSTTHFIRRLPEVIDQTAKTVTRGWEVVAREAPPVVVTMRSFRLALGRARYIELMAFIGAIQDAEQKFQAQTFVEYSLTVSEDHPLVLQIAAALKKSEAEMKAIFAAAQTLDNPTP